MLPRLSQVGAVAGTIQRHLALFAAARGQMRPWTAGQKRFSLRISQIAQAQILFSAQYYVIPDYVIPAASPDECVRGSTVSGKRDGGAADALSLP